MIKVSDEILLKPFNIEDASSIFNVLDSERDYMRVWLPFVDHTHKEEDTRDALAHLMTVDEQFTIWWLGGFVGLIGFKGTDEINKKIEIGYWLSQKAQGRGIMVRSVLALIKYAFEELEMNRVQIKAAVNNIPSRAIPEKLGFLFEGIERDGELLVDNVYTDIAVYSLLRKEFNNKIS